MNKGETSKIIIIAIVLAIILAGIVWWTQTQNLNAPTIDEMEDTTQVDPEVTDIQNDIANLEELNVDSELQSELEADLNAL
jgi:hypothetical protein